jgi:hypothetical protein
MRLEIAFATYRNLAEESELAAQTTPANCRPSSDAIWRASHWSATSKTALQLLGLVAGRPKRTTRSRSTRRVVASVTSPRTRPIVAQASRLPRSSQSLRRQGPLFACLPAATDREIEEVSISGTAERAVVR